MRSRVNRVRAPLWRRDSGSASLEPGGRRGAHRVARHFQKSSLLTVSPEGGEDRTGAGAVACTPREALPSSTERGNGQRGRRSSSVTLTGAGVGARRGQSGRASSGVQSAGPAMGSVRDRC